MIISVPPKHPRNLHYACITNLWHFGPTCTKGAFGLTLLSMFHLHQNPQQEKMVNGMNLKEVSLHHVCEAYIEDKHQRTSFPKNETTRASELLERVDSDVCGPMKTTSRGGA
jgi:hypothetical protein